MYNNLKFSTTKKSKNLFINRSKLSWNYSKLSWNCSRAVDWVVNMIGIWKKLWKIEGPKTNYTVSSSKTQDSSKSPKNFKKSKKVHKSPKKSKKSKKVQVHLAIFSEIGLLWTFLDPDPPRFRITLVLFSAK